MRCAVPIAVVLGSAGWGCGAPPGSPRSPTPDTAVAADTAAPPGPDTPAGLRLSAVEWAVDWARDGVRWREEGGWALQRDDGLELEVHEGWLVVSVLVLEPCDEDGLRRTAPPPHGLPDHGSALGASLATSLTALTPVGGTAHRFEPDDFCALGLGLLRGDTTTENVPEDVNLDGVSLSLTGRYRTAPTAEWTALSLRSSLPAEADLPLPESALSEAVRATVQLQPVALVAALDPAELPERVALDMLEALATTATVALDPLPSTSESP